MALTGEDGWKTARRGVRAVVDRHDGEAEVGKAEGGQIAFPLRLPLHPRADE